MTFKPITVRLAALAALSAAGTTVAVTAIEASPARAASPASMRSLHRTDVVLDLLWWVMWFLELEAEGNTSQAMSAIADQFHTYGNPTGLSQAEINTAVGKIDQLKSIFQSTPLPDGVDTTEAAAFVLVLNEMRDDLIPPN